MRIIVLANNPERGIKFVVESLASGPIKYGGSLSHTVSMELQNGDTIRVLPSCYSLRGYKADIIYIPFGDHAVDTDFVTIATGMSSYKKSIIYYKEVEGCML